MPHTTHTGASGAATRPYVGLDSSNEFNARDVVDVAFVKHARLLLQQHRQSEDNIQSGSREERHGVDDYTNVMASPIARCVLLYDKAASQSEQSGHNNYNSNQKGKHKNGDDNSNNDNTSSQVLSFNGTADPVGTRCKGSVPSVPLALARRGVVMRDPLLKRLEKKKSMRMTQQYNSHVAAGEGSRAGLPNRPSELGTALSLSKFAASTTASEPPTAAPHGCNQSHSVADADVAPYTVLHWTKRRLSEMNRASWYTFREQVGIEMEIVNRRAHSTAVGLPAPNSAETGMRNGGSNTNAQDTLNTDEPQQQRPDVPTTAVSTHKSSADKSLRCTMDRIAPIRCWEEAQLPYALGRRVTELYRFPTAIQSVLVPWATGQSGLPAGHSLPGKRCHSSTTTGAQPATAERDWVDIIAVAETGSGKTAAYLIPLLVGIHLAHPKLLACDELIALGPFALVLVPTRELAEQVTHELHRILAPFQHGSNRSATTATTSNSDSRHHSDLTYSCSSNTSLDSNPMHAWEREELSSLDAAAQSHFIATHNLWGEIRVVKVVGGERSEVQYAALSRGAHVVVGTVGQLASLRNDRLLSLGNVCHVVIDEADRMVETGAQEELLVAVLQQCPQPRQTILVSATLPPRCVRLAQSYLSADGYVVMRCPHRCAQITQCFECVSDAVVQSAVDESSSADTTDANDLSHLRGRPRKQKKKDELGSTRSGTMSGTRVLHPLIHPDKFNRLVSWLVYAPGRVVVFANEKKTCDALQDELRREHEFLTVGSDGFTVQEMIGPAPTALCFDKAKSNEDDTEGPRTDRNYHQTIHFDSSSSSGNNNPGGGPAAQLDHLRSVAVVHADLSQAERNRLVQSFQRGDRRVLLTTDLLARGLDVAQVALVINYDMPKTHPSHMHAPSTVKPKCDDNNNNSKYSSEDDGAAAGMTLYVHRIGRTGRAGHRGMTASFLVVPCATLQRAQHRSANSNNSSGSDSIMLSRLISRDEETRVRARETAELTHGHDNTSLAAYSSDGEVQNDDSEDGNEEDDDLGESESASHTTAKLRKGATRRRARRDLAGGGSGEREAGWNVFYNDEALFVGLWQFLCRCAEANGCRDGAQALRQGSYRGIQLSPTLAAILHTSSLRSSTLGSIIR